MRKHIQRRPSSDRLGPIPDSLIEADMIFTPGMRRFIKGIVLVCVGVSFLAMAKATQTLHEENVALRSAVEGVFLPVTRGNFVLGSPDFLK